MNTPSRRRFLAALGATPVVTASGCTGETDDGPNGAATDSPTDSGGGNGPNVSEESRQPTIYGSHKDEPLPHPDFDGITTGPWLSTGRITRPHRPVVTWIQSSGETEVPIGFDSMRVRDYLQQTSFGDQGVLVLRTNITNDCDAVDVANVAVEGDRVVVETVHERIEGGRETCHQRSPSDSWPACLSTP